MLGKEVSSSQEASSSFLLKKRSPDSRGPSVLPPAVGRLASPKKEKRSALGITSLS